MSVDKLQSFFKGFASAEKELDFHFASDVIGQKLEVIKTGSLVLDDALSSGGLPKGRLIQFYGSSGSGKTLLAMLAMLQAQKSDPSASQMFIDAEQTFSPSWADTLGLDTSKIIVIDGELAVNGRRCFEMLLGVPKEDAKTHALAGKKTEGLLDKIANKEFNINTIVLDSLGAIIPPGEDTSAVGKMNMSLLSRFLTPTFRKLSLEVNKANIPMIIINHTKATMDSYGPDHTYSGGNTYTHFLSANIYFTTVNAKDSQILDEKEQKIGSTIRATVEKSKFGPWPRKCEFKVKFDEGIIDLHEEVATLALQYNIVRKTSTVTHEYGDMKWTGYPKFCEGIKENPELMAELIAKIEEAREAKLDLKRKEQEEKKSKNLISQSEEETVVEEDKKSKKKKSES